MRRHVPDFLLVDRDGGVTVVNVKPADQLAVPKVADALAWAGDGVRRPGLASRDLVGGRAGAAGQRPVPGRLTGIADRVDAALAAAVTGRPAAPVSIGELEAAWPEPRRRDARPRCCTWSGGACLRADLTVPLSAATVLERAA